MIVPELHGDDERYHLHLGLNRHVREGELERLWPHGWMDVRRIRVAGGAGARAKTNKAAYYLAEYVGKSFDDAGDVGCGRHRYEVGQGFAPRSTGDVLETEAEARAWIGVRMGGEVPTFEWSSHDMEGWAGQPTRGLRWEG